MFIEIVSWDLLFPLTEEMCTLIKHLILRTLVEHRKEAGKSNNERNLEKNGESVPVFKDI